MTSTAKKSSLLRLASDPNHSFVDEFDRFVVVLKEIHYENLGIYFSHHLHLGFCNLLCSSFKIDLTVLIKNGT